MSGPSSSHLNAAKTISLLVLCLAFLIILKPSRLRVGMEDLIGQGSKLLETLVIPWETFADQLHLLDLSKIQSDFFSTHSQLLSNLDLWPLAQKLFQNKIQNEAQASLNLAAIPTPDARPELLVLPDNNFSFTGQSSAPARLSPAPEVPTDQPQTSFWQQPLATILSDLTYGHPWTLLGQPHAKTLTNHSFDNPMSCTFKKWTGHLCPVHARVPWQHTKTRILLAGDSLMQGLENTLVRYFRTHEHIELYRASVCSTGLSRKDYFDWAKHMAKLVAEIDPDIVVLFLGGNDAQDIVDPNKKRHIRGSDSWLDLYQKRAEELAQIAQSKGARLVWVGLPIMGNETTEKYIRLLTARHQAACTLGTGRTFVDTYAQLTDDNREYTPFVQDDHGKHVRIRLKDKIHLAEAGYRILLKSIVPVLEQELPEINLPIAGLDPAQTKETSSLTTTLPNLTPEGT